MATDSGDSFRYYASTVIDSLQTSNDDVARGLATQMFPSVWGPFSDNARVNYSLVALGQAIEDQDRLVAYATLPEDREYLLNVPAAAREWGLRFLSRALSEVRELICGSSKRYKDIRDKYGAYSQQGATALAVAIAASFGLSNPVALGVATLLILTVVTVAHNTFCDMTNEEVLKKVAQAATPPEPES